MNKQAFMIIFPCLYIMGIIAFFSDFLLTLSLIILTGIIIFFLKNNKIHILYIISFIFVFVFGIFNSLIHINYDDELTSFADNNVEANAKVLSIPTNNIRDKTKFYVQISSIRNEYFQKDNLNSKSYVTINDKTTKLKNIKIGDNIILHGRLKIPQQAQNPSQFDYYKYLQLKNTFSLIYADENWEITSRAENLSGKFIRKLNDTRNNILALHAKNIKSPMLEILGGIIFGDDAVNPDEETKSSFINSGIFHILAASGMNVTLIFGIWFFLAKSLRLNYRFSIITGILLILFYTFMTGFGPPIIRATLMLTLVLTGKLIDKESSTISMLFLVAFLMLCFNPLMLYDIGFQLSFIVTFALILTAPLFVFNFKNKIINNILGACCIPVVAQFYAAPLQMFYFNTFTVYSVLANIAIIPVLSFVSFIGFISSILAMISPIAVWVCKIADFILNPLLIYIVKTAKLFSEFPYSVIYVRKPLLIQIILYFAIIISLTILFKMKIKLKKLFISVCVIAFIFALTFIHIPDKNLEILFFSVGNADSVLIKSPNNQYFMIDTGKIGYLEGNSQAKNIMIKYLKEKGIKTVNSVIVTHFDADHAGGTVDILKEVQVERLYITDVYENTQLSENIMNHIKTNNVNFEIFEKIKEIYKENDFIITLIKPSGEKIKTENQKSLVTHISYKNKNFLFMGDGDIYTYNSLPDKYKNNITAMKSGHHGAKDTVSQDMTKQTELFILSTGSNIYNHPHPETVSTIIQNNSKYLRTDYGNAIKIVSDAKNIKIYTYSPKYKSFIKAQ